MDVQTFQDDLFDLQNFANRLSRFIETEHSFVEGSLVISLTSKYGSGKSTFLRMWKNSLENSDDPEKIPLVISLNAWVSDYYGDPLFAIISALVDNLEREGGDPKPLLEAVKNYGWFTVAIGTQILSKSTGVDPIEASAFMEEKKANRSGSKQLIPNTFSAYEGRKTAMDTLKRAIHDLVSSSEPKVLFLVDELDRCRPDYAISYLETIKHIFDTKGAVFILAADRQQLENSAKTAFGSNLNFEEYFRKFVHREVSLPPITKTGYENLAKHYVDYYLVKEGSRFCFMRIDHDFLENITNLIASLKLTPRQIQEVFRILGHLLETTEEKQGNLLWALAIGSITMAVFKIGKPDFYKSLEAGKLDPSHAVNFLRLIYNEDYIIEWWILLFYTGGGLYSNNSNIDDILNKIGLNCEIENIKRTISKFNNGWGFRSGNRFNVIHDNIEQIIQWN